MGLDALSTEELSWPDPQEGRLHFAAGQSGAENTFVSPPRLPQCKATVLYDPRSDPPLAAAQGAAAAPLPSNWDPSLGAAPSSSKGDRGDRCIFGHELSIIRPRAAGAAAAPTLACSRCQMSIERRDGYGRCAVCNYDVCVACLRRAGDGASALRSPPAPPLAGPVPPPVDAVLPFPRLTTEEDKLGELWGILPGPVPGKGAITRRIHPPPPSSGLLLPRAPDDPPPCISAGMRWMKTEWKREGGVDGGPPPHIMEAIPAAALLGGAAGDAGPPLGRAWVVRGDDAAASGACERALRPDEIVAWHDEETGFLCCGDIIEHAGGPRDAYRVHVRDPIEDRTKRRFLRRARLHPPPKEKEAVIPAVRLASVGGEKGWRRIEKQEREVEQVLSGACQRMLSLMDGCPHTDGPTLRREKGRRDRGTHAEYAQCRWCGKVLCVNWQTAERQPDGATSVSYYRTEYDDRGTTLLRTGDPYANYREDVEPELPHGLRRPGGRGWTRKVVLFLPELMQLNAAGYLHTADCRWLTARRARAPDVAQWELCWQSSPYGSGWIRPSAVAQCLYGPSLLLPGAAPLGAPPPGGAEGSPPAGDGAETVQ
eukprot:TRINITY_DN29588_c0_g1_i1.p1 TRINITY_DN29588_c0_g1~~TRINITY_DN29588_c0_g1_i1.p1  ORF type:complete len:616 (+),score=154.44 TRINITY_DN29588_c0_g1_i1:61-1848(+)